ncbi:Innexin 7 [Carabus blaptoides fortunei]
MLKTFEELKKNFKIKPSDVVIDNMVFKLHYRLTALFLMIATVLVSSRQYIGEHIHCISDDGVAKNVMDTFCFFTTTFTVPKHMNSTLVEKGAIPHPGVGPYVAGEDEEIHHAYYQWVPFVLFGQAIAFYLPHYIWKRQEGGRLKKIVSGLQYSAYALVDKDIKISDHEVPAISKRDKQLEEVKQVLLDRLHIDKTWSLWFVFCEFLNSVNVILQVYLTNLFLSGNFYSLGPKVLEDGLDGEVYVLDIVFPKVTKCSFHKYGPSGTIQNYDAMCVMALNIINEKIYTFLWFCNCPGKLNPWQVLHVTREFHFADWLFLYYLSKNMDGYVFMKLFLGLAESMDNMDSKAEEPLITIDLDEKEKIV